jgi:hypothetical protein
MSSGGNDDRSNTKAVVNGSMSKVSEGKTWLDHFENKQSGMIDLLILEGIYSIRETANKVKYIFPNVTNVSNRVQSHIDHLHDGDARGRASGMKPHKLRIIKGANYKIKIFLD